MTTTRDAAPPFRRALAIFCGALALRLVYLLLIRSTACLDINLDPIGDMEAFHRWALTIVGGDWLGRSDFHPFHPWQIAVASAEQWAAWYGHVFHQEPLYPYFIALVYLVAPREPFSVIVVQMVLGAAGCAFTYLAARRLCPEGAALSAGILSAIYGPYLYYESLLLRDSFLIPVSALLLWLLGEAATREDRGQPARRWRAVSGLVAGIIYVTKAAILPFFALLLVWEARRRETGLGSVPRYVGPLLMAAGFAAALAPVAARNVAVGAPAMKITTRGPIEFINGNNPWHGGIGWFDGDDARVGTYARDTLARAGGRLLPTIRSVVGDWAGTPLGLIRLQLVKAAYFFAPFEMPNNASYSYFRVNNAVLRRTTLSFFWISPLALVGLLESTRRWRRFVPLYLYLGAGVLTTIAFYVIARFRAPFMPGFLILAGLGLWSLISYAREGRWRALAPGLATALLALAANAAGDYKDRDLIRPQDHLISIDGYRSRGQFQEALREAELGRTAFPMFPVFHRHAAALYESLGRIPEATAALREALARNPSDEQARRDLLRLQGSAPP